MFRLLGRYVFREILTSSVLGALLATFVVFLRTAADNLFDVLVRSSSATPHTILMLFAWALPPVLPLTIPFGVLVGILVGLGRLSSDGEIIAMRAAGVSSRRVIAPVLLFAAIGTGVAAFCSLRLTPLAVRESTAIINKLMSTQLSAEIEPRSFDEDFPNHIVYVGDMKPGPAVVWKQVFIADVTPPEQRSSGMKEKAAGPMITVAREAIAVPELAQNRLQLTMTDASTHEMGKDGVANDQSSEHSQQVLEASPPAQKSLRSASMNTRQLIAYRGPDWLEYKIELHKRFALPVACFVLAMVGIPLGIATRKGGKSAAYVNAIFMAFFCYYLSFFTLINLARQGVLPVQVALWLPNAVLGLVGIVFLYRIELPGDRDLMMSVTGAFGAVWERLKSKTTASGQRRKSTGWRLPLLPQIVDTYLLSGFLFYLGLILAGFVSLTLIFNFFDLMPDMVRHHISLIKMFTYLFFLTPMLIYETLPISILVAVLVTLGVLSKQNEVTAFRACGVSLYRLAMPLLLGSTLFSAGLFAFDYYYVPGANRKQDALRDEIKGRPVQSYYRPDRKWIMGQGSRIYYYKYFDTTEQMMGEVNVFELDPKTFRLKREVVADRARWSSSLKTWVFENGWTAHFKDMASDSYTRFPLTMSFPETNEPPDYFLKENLQYKQMNFLVLERYIAGLASSGFNTVKFQVQFYRKFSVPLFALIMAMIAVPFGFLVGNRGAMTGIGVSIAIGIAYLALGTLSEKLGDVSLLPPAMAAWSPDIVFSLAGMYLLMRMRS